MPGMWRWAIGCALSWCCCAQIARADELHVAVAANFIGPLDKLAALYERTQGHKVVASPGSSGQLYAQIEHGAPYDVMLSADAERPAKLEAQGLAVEGTRFTYAIGRLVLWSPKPGVVDGGGAVLERDDLHFVALADPKTAPYGAAAAQVLAALHRLDSLRAQRRLAMGASIAQTYQFVATGHAECGFVALSQVLGEDGKLSGSAWIVPASLYAPLRQQAVLLRASKQPALARHFLKWLRTDPSALAIIRGAGYGLDPERRASRGSEAP